jgi:hypothetical protein
MPNDCVLFTEEFRRIDSLPRVDYEKIGARWHGEIQEALRTPHGDMILKPWQAAALVYALECQGLFVSAGVGSGKTLVSLLIPVMVDARRPVLMLPAAAREKTYAEIPEYRKHFLLHPYLQILSYEELSRISGVEALHAMRPDWVIADEAHKLKDITTARGRRFMRFFKEHPETRLVPMTGTPTTNTLHDYAHLLRLALPGVNCPLPNNYRELEMWAGALDKEPRRLVYPGALTTWCAPKENVRQAWQRRLSSTKGVILTTASSCDAQLLLDFKKPTVPENVIEAIKKLYAEWVTPGGEECQYAMELWRHGRELSCGFYYRWVWPRVKGVPQINQRWLDARADWHKFVRQTIRTHRRFDSPKAVEIGVMKGEIKYGMKLWEQWEAVRPEYKPMVEPVWLSDFFVDAVIREARGRNALIWVEHSAFGARLAKKGLPYMGPKATQAEINTHQGSVGLSQRAHKEAKNLQVRHDNIVVSPSASGGEWEQMIGRTHRTGQLSDTVWVTTYHHTLAFQDSWLSALEGARYMQDTTGQKQKLLMMIGGAGK